MGKSRSTRWQASGYDPVLAEIRRLRKILYEAEGALDRADQHARPILEVGVDAIRHELSSTSRRLPKAG